MVRKESFEAIPGTEAVVQLPEEILKQMSTDAALCYRLLCAIRSGKLSPELARRKCGEIVHSRWLTTGEALMLLWMSDHQFTGITLRKLRFIVNFVVNIYFPMFFEIKVKHKIVDGPKHIVTLLRLLRSQPTEVVSIVKPYVQTGAWFSHPEALLLTLLASENKKDRRFAVKKVLELRGEEEFGDMEPRSRRTPKINFEANECKDVINWEKEEIHEPVFSCSLSTAEIKNIIGTPLQVVGYPLHTQSTERAVKLVTEASCTVCGVKKRHGYILSRVESREDVPAYDAKKNLLSFFNE